MDKPAHGAAVIGRPGDAVGVNRMVKRAIDISVSGALLLAAAPVLALGALAILLEDGRPVLFEQDRAGRRGRPFLLWKLRSLRVHGLDPEAVGQVHGDHMLVTRVGRIIRRLKIDELPQLFNVLRGEMSLVGPRPTLPEQVRGYDAFQRRRLLVPPGMTGWAQINGNVQVSWEQRIELDVWYVDHWSVGLDLRILLSTLRVVLFGESPNPKALQEAAAHAERSGRGGR